MEDIFPGSQKVHETTQLSMVQPFVFPKREITLSGKEALCEYMTQVVHWELIQEKDYLHCEKTGYLLEETSRIERVISLDPEKTPNTLHRETLVGTQNVTQLHYARKGMITPEMELWPFEKVLQQNLCEKRLPKVEQSYRQISTIQNRNL